MINLQSQAAEQKSSQLMPRANSEVLNEGTEKQESGKTFTNLMNEFLGLNIEQGSKKMQETKLKNTGFDSFGELVAKKEGGEVQLDLINLKKVGKKSLADSEGELQTIDLPDELLIQLSNLIQKNGGQEKLTETEIDAKTVSLQPVKEGEKQPKKPVTIEGSLKALNKLLDGLQIKRSGEKFVLTIPDSNTELTSEKKENIQNQVLQIVRQLSGDSDNKPLKHLFSEITANTDVQAKHSTNLEQVLMTNKETSAPTNFLSKNREWVTKNGDVPNGKAVESVSNGNQKADTQQTQKLTLKNLIRQFSEEVEIKTEKTTQSQNGFQQLNTESKESGLFPNSKESGLSAKQLTTKPDQNSKTDADLSKILPNENSKKEGEPASLKLKTQNTKESSPAKLVDKSPSKPIHVSSISEINKDETAFKPLVKIESQIGNADLEFQSQTDTDSGDSEEGKSFLKLNNTSFNQLTKSSGRREFSTQMVKQLQKQADQSGLGTAKNWSQHRFVLESGDSVNVAVKQAEGVMQLQLGAGNSELNKILVQHINEIRQHLQEQMNIDIDLQLQQFGDQQTDLNNDNGQNSGNGKQESNDGTGLRQHAEGEVGGSITRTRYLGFNQNEWTA